MKLKIMDLYFCNTDLYLTTKYKKIKQRALKIKAKKFDVIRFLDVCIEFVM